MDKRNVVIIGNGIAAAKALAEAKKTGGSDVVLSVIGKEEFGPYPRPKLPELVSGSLSSSFFKTNSIASGEHAYYRDPVISLDAEKKELLLKSGRTIHYDTLIIANGSVPNALDVPLSGLSGIMHFRTVADAERIISNVDENCTSALIIGAGVLGLEAALAIKKRKNIDVTVVEGREYILPVQLDQEASLFLESLLVEKGLTFKKGVSLIEYRSGDGENLSSAVFSDGSEVNCTLSLEAIGVRPDTSPFKSSGISINRGIVIDDRAETSVKDIYAAGDVAEFDGKCPGLVSFANMTARVAGINAAGGDARLVLPSSSAFMKVDDISFYSLGSRNGYSRCVEKKEGKRYERYFLSEEDILLGTIGIGSESNMTKALAMIGKKFSDSILSWD